MLSSHPSPAGLKATPNSAQASLMTVLSSLPGARDWLYIGSVRGENLATHCTTSLALTVLISEKSGSVTIVGRISECQGEALQNF